MKGIHRQGHTFYYRHWVGDLQLKVSLRTRCYDEAAALASLLGYHRSMAENNTDDYQTLRKHLKGVYSQLVDHHRQQAATDIFKTASTYELTRGVPERLVGPVMAQLEPLSDRAAIAVSEELLGVSDDANRPVSAQQEPAVTLGELYDLVEADKVATGSWGKHSRRNYASKIRQFIDILGDKPINQYAKTDIREWRNGMNLKPSSVNTALKMVAAVFEWAVSNELLEKNPVTGLTVRDDAGSRRAITPDELTGLLDRLRPDDGWRYDAIMMGAYTGCRVAELTQLSRDDLKQVDGVWVIDLTKKQVKSKAGKRLVPLHPELMYLLDREGPLLGVHRTTVGGWFSNTKSEWGFGDDVVYHSLRKTVATQLHRAGVPESHAAAILGHSGGTSTLSYGLYSDGVTLATLAHAVEQVHYPV